MRFTLIFLLLINLHSNVWSFKLTGTETTADSLINDQFFREITEMYKQMDFGSFLYVSITKQRLYHVAEFRVVREYIVSTSKYGTGGGGGSYKTPLGLHKVEDKFGYRMPIAGIFKHRVGTDKIAEIITAPEVSNEDNILTRILWLRGMEQGINAGGEVDTYERRIYLHGTDEEGLIGQPASNGCIRLRNKDIVELFEIAYFGIPVIIRE